MQNLGNFELNFTKIDKKLRLQTNFTDVYETSKFYRKVISFRSMRLKGSTQITDTQARLALKLKRQKICSTILFHFKIKVLV